MHSLTAWLETWKKAATGEPISSLLGSDQTEKKLYYIKSMEVVIQFLCINKLPLHGSVESTKQIASSADDMFSGLFLKLFEYTLTKDQNISQSIPANTKYVTQNEIIEMIMQTHHSSVLKVD